MDRQTAQPPSASTLVDAALALDLGGKSDLDQSLAFLKRKEDDAALYDFVDDVVVDAFVDDSPNPQLSVKDAKALVHHLTVVRSAVARVLWTRELFVGYSVLDDLIFEATKRGDPDGPILAVFRTIVEREMYQPGLVVYPLHGFGVLAAGLANAANHEHITLLSEEFGFALSPQTNSIDRTIDFIREAGDQLGTQKPVPEDLLHHWERSRPAKWMARNPLLITRVATVPGNYHENQFLLVGRLRLITTFLTMLATLQPTSATRAEEVFSSASINNFETLDLKHYMVLADFPGKEDALDGQFVPMNGSPLTLAELSDLPIDLHADHWIDNLGEARRVFAALEHCYSQRLKLSFGAEAHSSEARLYRKLERSLVYFHRSFSRSHESWQSTVSLAIALETMVTDSYSGGVAARVTRRVELLLDGNLRQAQLTQSVRAIYAARGQLMHGEHVDEPPSLIDAREAYVHAFVELVSRIPPRFATAPDNAPMQHICGDLDTQPTWKERLAAAFKWRPRRT